VVITSGLGGSYQSGLIVGTVVSVGKSSAGTVGDIIVNPNDSASLLEEVIVVMDDAALEKANQAQGENAADGEGTSADAQSADDENEMTVAEAAAQG